MTKLKAVKPEKIQKRLKIFMYGEAGSGKTKTALGFPSPYFIDTEKGAENDEYIEELNKNNGVILQSCDFEEVVSQVFALLSEKHQYKTLVIDPLTTIYNNVLDICAKEVGTEFGRHYGEANKKMKHLIGLILRLDMNVVITSHAKNEYGKDLVILGKTFDCYKKIDYLFDLVLEIDKRADKRFAIIKKSRIKAFKEFDQFEIKFEEIAKRYGSESLLEAPKPAYLANDDDIKKLSHLIETLNIPQTTIDKWLLKSDANNFSEMPKDIIEKIIDSLLNKINKG